MYEACDSQIFRSGRSRTTNPKESVQLVSPLELVPLLQFDYRSDCHRSPLLPVRNDDIIDIRR